MVSGADWGRGCATAYSKCIYQSEGRGCAKSQPSCFLVFAGCLVIHGPDARYPAKVLTAHV